MRNKLNMPLLPNSLVTNWEQVVYIGTQKERERRDHDGIMCTCVRPSVHKVVDTTSLLGFNKQIISKINFWGVCWSVDIKTPCV